MEEGIKGAVMLGVELTAEERDLLARAYEHQVTRMRKSWSRIAACEERERRSAERCGARLGHVVKYRLTLESEIRNLCSDLFTLLEVHLIPHAGTSEALVFFLKMKANYHGHLADLGSEDERKMAIENAQRCFRQASELSMKLSPAHPVRLALALSLSVFLHDVLKQTQRASAIAKEAFNGAIAELDTLDEESYKDSTRTMQALRDCLMFRSSVGADTLKHHRRPKERRSEV